MTNLQRLLLPLSSLLTVTAGCAGEHEPARFADATPAQLERAFLAGSGGDASIAVFLGVLFSGSISDPTACPSIETTGATTTVRGGCERADGGRVEGSLVTENLPGLSGEYDPSLPGRVTYDAFTIVEPDGAELIFDGVVEVNAAGPALAADLTVTGDGIASTSRLTLECNAYDLCDALPGSEIAIDELGRADVEGTWSLEREATGAVFLRGEDTVIFDLYASAGSDCIPYVLDDGRVGEICDVEEVR